MTQPQSPVVAHDDTDLRHDRVLTDCLKFPVRVDNHPASITKQTEPLNL
jgi:hypothetical protein